MAVKLYPDRILVLTTIGLTSFGLVMLYSASAVVAHDAHRTSHFFLVKQSMWAACGLLAMLLLARSDYRRLRRPFYVYGLLGASVALLVAVLLAPPINNVHRWLRLGQLSIQPSEIAKLSLILCLAYQLDRRRERLREFFAGWFPSLAVTGLLAFLVLIEPDYSTAFCLVFIGSSMLFLSGVPLRQLAGLALVSAPMLSWLMLAEDYRRERLLVFLDPFSDPLGKGFQIIQSLIAVGSGGVLGNGFMMSQQKLFYLPTPHSDFIFAVIGEELGLAGSLLVVFAFCVFLWRGFVIAGRAADGFGALLAAGLTVFVVGQAFINMAVTLGLLPTTGLPLPFISSGGSSLLAGMAAAGLLLSVSQHAR